jgi:hypothetical protein
MSDAGSSRLKSPTLSARPLGNLTNTSKTNISVKDDSDIIMMDTPGLVIIRDKKDEVKVEPFHGERSKLIPFLLQLKVVFKLNPDKYDRDTDKAMFAAMHLKGPAFQWFQPTLEDYVDASTPDKDTLLCFERFAEFEERIKMVFGTINEARAASRAIYQIKQRGSAAAYYSEF